MAALTPDHCPKLESFKMNILRALSFGSVEWNRSSQGESASWVGGIVDGKKE